MPFFPSFSLPELRHFREINLSRYDRKRERSIFFSRTSPFPALEINFSSWILFHCSQWCTVSNLGVSRFARTLFLNEENRASVTCPCPFFSRMSLWDAFGGISPFLFLQSFRLCEEDLFLGAQRCDVPPPRVKQSSPLFLMIRRRRGGFPLPPPCPPGRCY